MDCPLASMPDIAVDGVVWNRHDPEVSGVSIFAAEGVAPEETKEWFIRRESVWRVKLGVL